MCIQEGLRMKTKKVYYTAKRVFDFVCALIGIIVTSPLWLFAVIGIEISDPGPVFYMAKRVGKNNEVFDMFKFRSMRVIMGRMKRDLRRIKNVFLYLENLSED